jgi:inorganic pyrophosphatase
VHNLKNLPIGEKAPEIVNAVIEIPRGSRNKIEYDPELGIFKLDRVLFSAVHYPVAYGFIPGTLGGDGDPLDVLVFCDQPLETGIMVRVYPIGGLEMHDDKGHDLKIVGVAYDDPMVNHVKEVSELQDHRRLEIEYFFDTYKDLERKEVHVGHWFDAKEARELIEQGVSAFKTKL